PSYACPCALPLPPPSPVCTLLPYTTLFRSETSTAQVATVTSATAEIARRPAGAPEVADASTGEACSSRSRGSTPRWAGRGGSRRDRKSTRLNSSHQIISYAVFCLKKKKTSV